MPFYGVVFFMEKRTPPMMYVRSRVRGYINAARTARGILDETGSATPGSGDADVCVGRGRGERGA